MGFDADAEIQVDKSLHKSFVYGNGETNEAIGLAKITVGLLGKEAHVVDGATPHLLSSKVVCEQDFQIDFRKGHAWFKQWGEKVKLGRAPSYHLLLSILGFPGNEKDLEKLKILEEEGLSGVLRGLANARIPGRDSSTGEQWTCWEHAEWRSRERPNKRHPCTETRKHLWNWSEWPW